MKKSIWLVLGLAAMVVTAGCGETSDDGSTSTTGGEYGSRGLALMTDFLGGTDVAGMRYDIRKCGGGLVHESDQGLEDLLLPGMIPEFENRPFDEDSAHLFADKFVVLPAGCYDVKITPITISGDVSEDCASASASGVTVLDELTTEILLVSQCKGPERGALDVVGALNHPPVIQTLEYNPSKFVTCTEYNRRPEVKLCAEAYDPDSDPLEFEWKQVAGPSVYSGPRVVESYIDGGSKMECVKIKLPYGSASYEFELTVYDMFHNDVDLVRAEAWFALHDYGNVESRAKLRFPIHASCESANGPC